MKPFKTKKNGGLLYLDTVPLVSRSSTCMDELGVALIQKCTVYSRLRFLQDEKCNASNE